MDKRFWAIVGIIIVLFVGFLVVRGDDAAAPKSDAKPTSHTKGEGRANVTLVEYGDFQCAACAQYYPVLEQVIDKYGEDVTFQYRHFPIISIHKNAFAASRAAEAAGKQDKFWEMYDKLFAGQGDWAQLDNPNTVFESYALQLELDIDKYSKDFRSSEVNDAINADRAAGEALKITGTPTFVLNGKVLDSVPPTLEAFSKILDEALDSKE
jgi:protein-disulfide isomerase